MKESLGFLPRLILFIFIIPNIAQARFMVEPGYATYQGRFKGEDGLGSLTGHVGQLNLGYLGEAFMMGIALEQGQFSYDSNVFTQGYKHFDGGGVGTFLGFHFFDRIKLWTTYLNSTLEPTKNKDIRYFGQFISFGLGLRLHDGLLLNLTSFSNHFTQEENDDTGKTNGLATNIKTQGQSLGLSYILAF